MRGKLVNCRLTFSEGATAFWKKRRTLSKDFVRRTVLWPFGFMAIHSDRPPWDPGFPYDFALDRNTVCVSSNSTLSFRPYRSPRRIMAALNLSIRAQTVRRLLFQAVCASHLPWKLSINARGAPVPRPICKSKGRSLAVGAQQIQ